ncbi:MAG: ABC transporter ATP-binding protein [Clostridium sp.]|uniref:ABC transporter ATP-binding protein n=1 Tax=Clostridium sp. TaxID=1506 RepID=UPI0025C1FFF7|nr:ABC transporter ATP-binding protein [Clostridium sp.]MCI9304797.1 ABC transporter ATP-binding protein [Clostridium sp.]
MLEFIKPYKKELFISFFIGIISSLLLLVIPKLMAYAIDVSFVNKNFMQIVLLSFIMLGIVLLSVFFTKIQRDKMIIALDKVSYDIKVEIFKKLQYLPNNYFDTRSHGKIYTRATSYPDDVAGIFCYVIVQGLLDIVNLIFVIVFMLITNTSLALISIISAIILITIFIFLAPLRRKLQHVVNDKKSNVNAYVSESINGIRITQSFNRENENERILRDLEKERINVQKKTFFIGNLNWSLAHVFDIICIALIYYIGLRYFYPRVSLGTIIAIDSYSSRFWDPLEYITSSYSDLMDASTYLERIFELLDEPLVIENSKKSMILDIKGDVELKNVVFSYDKKKKVLNHVNLKIKAGDKVGLVGETGCGKSTILSLLSRFYDPDEGEILIDGINIKDIRLNNLRGGVSIMLQDNFLFARSVYDNLVLNKKIKKEEVIKVCKMLDIHDMITNLEKGYETILLNNGSNLSNGERQLLCIARIMLQDPKILILDEATSNIDLMTEKKITKAIDLVTKDRTTIMVAHRISTIKNCDKIVLIKDHINYEEGTHNELMKKKGEYYKLYSSQAIQ